MIRVLLVLLLALGAAQAAEPKPLTYGELKMVADGLGQLDGYDRLAKDGAREFTVKAFFTFKKGLRGVIAENIVKARAGLRDLTDKNNELIRQYADGGDRVADKNLVEFTAAQRKLLDSPSGVTLQHIKVDELNLDENKEITGTALSFLDLILDK